MKPRSRFQVFMWAAALASLICTVALWALHARLGGAPLDALRITALTCFYHFAVRLLIGECLVPRFGAALCEPDRAWFRVGELERKLYQKLGVQRWKGDLPTYNPSEFDLQVQGLDGLVRSACRSELVHALNALASFVPLLFALRFGALPVFLLTSLAGALFDLSFVAVQRYNRPRLIRLLRARARSKEANAHESND